MDVERSGDRRVWRIGQSELQEKSGKEGFLNHSDVVLRNILAAPTHSSQLHPPLLLTSAHCKIIS